MAGDCTRPALYEESCSHRRGGVRGRSRIRTSLLCVVHTKKTLPPLALYSRHLAGRFLMTKAFGVAE